MKLGDLMRNPIRPTRPGAAFTFGIFVQGPDGLEYEITDPESREEHDSATGVAAYITLAYEAIGQNNWTVLVRNTATKETVWSYTTGLRRPHYRESPGDRAYEYQHGVGEGGREEWES